MALESKSIPCEKQHQYFNGFNCFVVYHRRIQIENKIHFFRNKNYVSKHIEFNDDVSCK